MADQYFYKSKINKNGEEEPTETVGAVQRDVAAPGAPIQKKPQQKRQPEIPEDRGRQKKRDRKNKN